MVAQQTGFSVAANAILAIASLSVLSAGIALLPLFAIPVALETDAALGPWIAAIRSFSWRLALALTAAGVIACGLQLSWLLAPGRVGGGPAQSNPPNPILAGGLVVLAVWVVGSSGPWRSMLLEGIARLKEWGVWDSISDTGDPVGAGFGILAIAGVLLLPLVQCATASWYLASSIAILLLIAAQRRYATRALVQCIALQAGLLFACVSCRDLFERLPQLLGTIAQGDVSPDFIDWVSATQQRASVGVRNLTWQLVAYALLLPIALRGAASGNVDRTAGIQ